MPGPLKRLEAGQQDELVGTAAARVAGGMSAVWRSRGELASITVAYQKLSQSLWLLKEILGY